MSWLLERLRKYKDDRGMMADLRCVLVDNKRHRAWPALSRLGLPIDNEVQAFIAGLFASHSEETERGNFGTTCRQIMKSRGENASDDNRLTAMERRFQQLLAAEKAEVYHRVRRMVLMANSQGIPVNYEQLQTDLRYWNDRTKTEWASAFWAQGGETPAEGET